MKLTLMDMNQELVEEWREAFARHSEVTVRAGDILAGTTGAVVSPANSQGFMDGGIDLHYRKFFGGGLEVRIQDTIARLHNGFLPVGAAVVVRTGHPKIGHIVVAPTMETPERVPSMNTLRAFTAALRAASLAGIEALFCPGMATGVGEVPAREAAQLMARGYDSWRRRQP